MTDQDHLRRAVELACESVARGGGPFGAVVVRDGEVIGEGMNRVVPDCDPSAHAEVTAIRAACQAVGDPHLTGCVLYASCEPCPMCAGAIQWARISRVVYAADRHLAAKAGFDDRHFHDQALRDPARREVPSVQLDLDAASEPFQRWRESGLSAY